jgi:hypothetical protein
MPGCLLVIVGFFFPRLVLACVFLFTHAFSQAYNSVIWPLLGFFCMPLTTLAYMGAMIYGNHQVTGGWLVALIAAVVLDLGGNGSAAKYRPK